jgi:small subunit ribosomal protein S7
MVQRKRNKLLRKNSGFLSRFINHVTKKGKKQLATKMVLAVLFSLSKEYKVSSSRLMSQIFFKIRPFIEVRSVRVRRSSFLVPFPVNLHRQYHLASFWILEALAKDKRKLDFETKMREEFVNILSKKGAVLEKRAEVYKLAQKNRANLHYRWY